jgi:hypothetical protein
MIPAPNLSNPLYKLIAQQTGLFKSPMFAYLNSPVFRRQTALLNSPMFAYLQSPAFHAMSERMGLINKITGPQTLAMRAVHEQQRRSEAMLREIASWHRHPASKIVQTGPTESDEAEVLWSTYLPDPNFGLRKNRWEEGG